MLIEQLFTKPIARPINGVIKADQSDAESVWQELEEYVVTKELDSHLRRFFDAYLSTIDHCHDPNSVGKVGVWVSGFFGSGKSHFIKILSYLLENRTVTHQGHTLRAIDFFQGKIQDALLAAEIQRATRVATDVILFNIDSKADATDGRDALLRVFLRVFNERLGFCGEHPHIAHMERYLARLGKFEAFKAQFAAASGYAWEAERDAYQFHADEVALALATVLEQAIPDAEGWIERFEKDFSLSVENFAKWVREYLDSRGPEHRICFLADEVGQFIGQDTHLMLSLQTITENLGTFCGGRAWIIVTSQEDIDAVLGEVRASRANDFSKIQGRFKTRLSLSSTHVDEVIQKRLLDKNSPARQVLSTLYRGESDILKNQLSFTHVGMTFRAFADEEDFVAIYPFVPYQFQLVQKIFENIRRVGATGLHLARGERSMLDAFQSAAIHIADQSTGVLVPLHRFYPSIESFLEGIVKSNIDNAARNSALKPFDSLLIKTLFLIRYVDEIRGTVDNLITLFIDRIDADRLALRQQVEDGLQRLEGQTLIGRNGEECFFLTNEERDISREIKDVEISGTEETHFLGELMFDDVLGSIKKHRYPENNKDFEINRLCDSHPHGTRTDGDLTLLIVTPLADDYGLYQDAKCTLDSSADHGKVIIRLEDDLALGRELRLYLQTEKYVTRKNNDTATLDTRTILRNRADENRQRRDRLKMLADQLVREGRYFAAGQLLTVRSASASRCVEEALNYLVKNSFFKLPWLRHLAKDPLAELQAVLVAVHPVNEISIQEEDANVQAIKDVAQYIALMKRENRQIILHNLIAERFSPHPYGWPEMEILLLVGKLVKQGEITLSMDGAVLPLERVFEAVQTPNKWRRITVMKRQTVDPELIQKAFRLAKEVFGKIAPTTEEPLFRFIQDGVTQWQSRLQEWGVLAKTGHTPGHSDITETQARLERLVGVTDSFTGITRFLEMEKDLLDGAEIIQELSHFHQAQKPAWDRLRDAVQRFQSNQRQLEKDAVAAPAWQRMEEILRAPAPYGMIKEGDGLIQTVAAINTRLLTERRDHALARIDERILAVKQEMENMYTTPALSNQCLLPLQTVRANLLAEGSIAHILQYQEEALEAFDEAIRTLEEASGRRPPQPDGLIVGGKVGNLAIRKWRVIRPKDLAKKSSLENQADVDAFLTALREKLEEAIQNDERIEIR
ncbi:MAG: BREX system P-loop protein BrxC [Magnetococcus sp. YQC-5]